MRIPINKPSITDLEIEYVRDAITNGWGSNCYDYINRFETSFADHLNTSHAHATSSCTGAIHLGLMALGIKSGDEVIVPEITWIASVEPVLYIGARPVFVDVLEDSWCIDPEKIEQAITSKTKAVLVVHLYGNVCDMEAIMGIAKKHDLKVIEDAAEGIGSEYKSQKVGSIGDVGTFSFHGTKTLSAGEGGMIVTNDAEIDHKVRVLNDHGRNSKDSENKTFWMRYYGYKYKISNLQAAMGCAQVERVEELIAKKRQIFKWYSDEFSHKSELFDLNVELSGTKNGYWLPTLMVNKELDFDREDFFDYSKKMGVDTRPFFYPLSYLPMFEDNRKNRVAYDLYRRGVNLPSYHDITLSNIKYVARMVNEFFYK